jgi:hypothetical protein
VLLKYLLASVIFYKFQRRSTPRQHFHSEGIHGNRERPSADGNWGSDEITQTVGKGVQTTLTLQDTGVTATGQLRRKEDGLTVSYPLLNGLLSHKKAPRGKSGLPGVKSGFSRRRPALQGQKVREVSRGLVPRMSADRRGALWPDTLTPAPKTKTGGGEPVDRGVAPRSCSPGTPKRGEHATRPLVDGATGPTWTKSC